jgi:hypothetical protein
MMQQKTFEEQARDFRNRHLVDRSITASVHLENKDDELFWNTLLQEYRPGKYNYIYHSKSDKGNETSGRSQCMKYAGLLSERFFICVDSDLWHLRQKPNIDAAHHIYQTYAYSWENHNCFADRLQQTLMDKCPEAAKKFDFRAFLNAYSAAVYEPLLLLLSMNRKKEEGFNQEKFNACLPQQVRSVDLGNNGTPIVCNIQKSLARFDSSKSTSGFALADEMAYYETLGLTESNAYLHIRGHNLYNIVCHIGTQLCSGHTIDFEKDVLKDALTLTGYWEIEQIGIDLQKNK